MIFKIYKENPDTCHFLMGTMHLATKEAYTHSETAIKYINQCKIFALEVHLDMVDQKELFELSQLPQDIQLMDLFTRKKFLRCKKSCKKYFGYDLESLAQFTPFYIFNLLLDTLFDKNKTLPLDHYLWDNALKNGCILKGLESYENQKHYLSQIPLDFQVKQLYKLFSNIGKFRQSIQLIATQYQEGKHYAIYQSTKKSLGVIRNMMLNERNQLMVNSIMEYTQEGRCFFAVGAAHLAGKNGILALLKKNGFKVKPINFDK